ALITRLQNPERAPQVLVLTPELVERASVGRR
ncbi:transcriptional regulator, partial [Serratia marcescens]